MQNSLAGCTISKEAKNHIIGAFVLLGKCQSGSGANLCTHNAVTTKKIHILTKKVHTTTFTFCTTGGLAIEFSHTAIHRYTFCNCKTMVTVSCNKSILWSGGCHTSSSNSFLPYIGMKETADFTFHFILFFSDQLKLADELHKLIPIEISFFRKTGCHLL